MFARVQPISLQLRPVPRGSVRFRHQPRSVRLPDLASTSTPIIPVPCAGALESCARNRPGESDEADRWLNALSQRASRALPDPSTLAATFRKPDAQSVLVATSCYLPPLHATQPRATPCFLYPVLCCSRIMFHLLLTCVMCVHGTQPQPTPCFLFSVLCCSRIMFHLLLTCVMCVVQLFSRGVMQGCRGKTPRRHFQSTNCVIALDARTRGCKDTRACFARGVKEFDRSPTALQPRKRRSEGKKVRADNQTHERTHTHTHAYADEQTTNKRAPILNYFAAPQRRRNERTNERTAKESVVVVVWWWRA